MFLFTVNVFHRVVVRIIVHFFFFSSFSVTVAPCQGSVGERKRWTVSEYTLVKVCLSQRCDKQGLFSGKPRVEIIRGDKKLRRGHLTVSLTSSCSCKCFNRDGSGEERRKVQWELC